MYFTDQWKNVIFQFAELEIRGVQPHVGVYELA